MFAPKILRSTCQTVAAGVQRRGLHMPDLSVEAALKPSGDAAAENQRLRRSLALSYRLLDRLDMNVGACNHLTVTAPAREGGGKRVMLLAPGFLPDQSSLHWADMTASALIGVDEEGNVVEEGRFGGGPEITAACIHLGTRKAKNAQVSVGPWLED